MVFELVRQHGESTGNDSFVSSEEIESRCTNMENLLAVATFFHAGEHVASLQTGYSAEASLLAPCYEKRHLHSL